jgi:hypothetical protein
MGRRQSQPGKPSVVLRFQAKPGSTAGDPVKGDVDISGKHGQLQIEAFFGETMEQKH